LSDVRIENLTCIVTLSFILNVIFNSSSQFHPQHSQILSQTPQTKMASHTEFYTLAHTARCKLQMAADRPDRNLRFILGHAFTLDKLRLRIAEIETDSSVSLSDSDSEEEFQPTCTNPTHDQGHGHGQRKVSFSSSQPPKPGLNTRARSPPPDELAAGNLEDEEDEDYDDDDIEDDYDADVGGEPLQRFGSAAAQPPRMISPEEDSDSDEEEMEPKSPEMMLPSEGDLQLLCGGEGDATLTQAYNHTLGCPCHGTKGPVVGNVWEIPGKVGEHGGRLAVVEVAE
jgi:hypothetical protein